MFRPTFVSCLGLLGFVSWGCSSASPPVTDNPVDSGPPSDLDATTFDATAPNDASDSAANAADTTVTDAMDAAASMDAMDGGDCSAVGTSGEPLELRCTGLYANWAQKTVAPDVHQYDPGLHLWSDGAVKTRWIYLPPNAADSGRAPIDTSNMDEWTFPVGTKLWKEFVLGGKRIETRLLWKQAVNNWYLTTYKWSADETTATEFTDGDVDANGLGYEIPAQYACAHCHNGRRDTVLGFEAVSLASPGATPITMGSLADAGWITQTPDASLAVPGSPTARAALGYLHANCGLACHNHNGEAQASGFWMRLESGKLGTVQSTDTWLTGVNRQSRFIIPGETGYSPRLAPYDAGASCVHYRMSVRTGVDDAGTGYQMPPIDTHKVDEAGVSAIENWINQGCGP